MTAKEARKCISMLEKAFGWKVYIYYMYISGSKRWLYDIKLSRCAFDDNSSSIFFRSCDGNDIDYESAGTEAAAVKQLVSASSGSMAYDLCDSSLEWKVPEFRSAEELRMKLEIQGQLMQ